LIGSLVVAVPADYTRYLMNRLRIIWGYHAELSSTAGQDVLRVRYCVLLMRSGERSAKDAL